VGKLRVAVLSFTCIAADSRVRRTIEALAAQGHEVTAIGYGDQHSATVPLVRLPDESSTITRRLEMLATELPSNVLPAASPMLHFMRLRNRVARQALIQLCPDVVHANDWMALPSAAAAKAATGARIVYDSHEFASEEHSDNTVWRIVAQRHTSFIEARFIVNADAVVTVSAGIAQALFKLHKLADLPTVVLNTPVYREVKPALLDKPRRMLVHGIMKAGRGIEATIGALSFLPDYTLTLRGNGAAGYLSRLHSLARSLGVADRVTFERAVPLEKVVEAASAAHFGVFCAPVNMPQNRYSMPNKLFEYLMAGLVLVVTRNGEAAQFVERLGCGTTASDSTPQAVGEAVRSLLPDQIQSMRARGLMAARRYSWEVEQTKLVELYERLGGSRAESGMAFAERSLVHGKGV
jgi:glycosyltransferase involved in cell wall biosynthesis